MNSRPVPALDAREVHKAFQVDKREVRALAGVSLQVTSARITGLVGPDGAGKTTLMRLACGLLRPDSGTITVLGIDAAAEPHRVQSCIGYMPQRFGLYEDLSVQENLDLYADMQGVPATDRAARFDELMSTTGLAPFLSRLAGQLSGGMKQKLGLACTLVRPPRLLLLDEPTVGVDPVSRRDLWQIIQSLVESEGMTLLLSTAYLDEAERCSEVILLHQGAVLNQGRPDDLSRGLQGRVWGLSHAGDRPRLLQRQLSENRQIVDVSLEAGTIRLVTAAPGSPTLSVPLGGKLEPLAARFEDAFIEELRQQGAASGGDGTGPVPSREGIKVHADPAPRQPTIVVRELVRRFGTFEAVRNLSFSVARGEIFGLLGANGAGKTTTFRMLCGLLPPSSGELFLAGIDVRRSTAAARARLGYMAQKFSLYGNLRVIQNLRFFASTYGLSGKRLRMRLQWALEAFQLDPDAVSAHLPEGYRKRLAMACALMHEPEILFLDEPTSGVDPLARRGFWRRINGLAEAGVTVLVTTHFMEEAENCDRLAIMAAGELLSIGSPEEIRAQARSPSLPWPSLEDSFIHLIEAREASA